MWLGRLLVTCKDSLYFLVQQDCAPLSLAYRLVTCHNSLVDDVVTDWTLNRFDNTGSPTEQQRVARLTVVLWL